MRFYPLLILALGTQCSIAGWSVSVRLESDPSFAGEARVGFKPDRDEPKGHATFALALAELKKRNKLLRLNSISLEILPDDEYNKELLNELRKREPKTLASLSKDDGRMWHHHPKVQKLRKQLEPSVLAMKKFRGLQKDLAPHGLTISGVNCEKFSFVREKGELKIFGFRIYLEVAPKDYGMGQPNAKKPEASDRLHCDNFFKEGDQWIGQFSFFNRGPNSIRLYGKWSAKHKTYTITSFRAGWCEGNDWKCDQRPTFGEKAISFRLKPKVWHRIRIPLGKESRARMGIRIYGPKQSVTSEDFSLIVNNHRFKPTKTTLPKDKP